MPLTPGTRFDGPRKATPFIATPARKYGPEFSPDGKWIAYVSEESGGKEIYVTSYPGPGAVASL